MEKSVKLKDVIKTVLDGFNQNNKELNNPESFRIEIVEREVEHIVRVGKKKVPTKAKAFVGSLLLYLDRDGVSSILHVLNIPLPSKYSERLTTDWHGELYKQFLYDTIGLFCVYNMQAVDRREKAAFDLEKNRFEQDAFYKDKKIKVRMFELRPSDEEPWYKANEEYEVFTRTDEAWAVYSNLEIHKANKGIGLIKTIHATLIEEEPA